MDITVWALETEFDVTNMVQLHWLLKIQITFNHHSIKLSQKALVDKILESSLMNDSQSDASPY
jgi:hypothetical protein